MNPANFCIQRFSLLLAGPASDGPLVESTICEKYAKRAANFVQQCKVRMSSQGIRVIKLDRVEISAEPWNWEFAITQRDQITRSQEKRAAGTVEWSSPPYASLHA
jgi:hypothetical protein